MESMVRLGFCNEGHEGINFFCEKCPMCELSEEVAAEFARELARLNDVIYELKAESDKNALIKHIRELKTDRKEVTCG